ncbi:MAG: ATP-binding cassette domain-containing protein, partial [Candidatus Bipolaricaulia bacterium]
MAILRADNLRFGYEKGREVLHGIDLEVNRGEDFCLLGPSGAGKTTLLRLLNLLCKPTSGEIRFNFEAESPARDGELELRRRMAMVFQEAALFDTTVWGNVAYGLLSRMGLMTRVKERWAGLLNGRSDLD